MPGLVFWDVDTQYDFLYPDGRLYVPRAEPIVPRLKALTEFAHARGIRIVASSEVHHPGDPEFSVTPDFDTTWPEHCLAGTPGQRKVPETTLRNPLTLGPERQSAESVRSRLQTHSGDVLLLKRHFDVFTNGNADVVLRALDPTAVVVYGVPLEICVRFAVEGILERRPHARLYLVTDAVKAVRFELGEHALKQWGEAGARLVKTEEVVSDGVLDALLAAR